MYESENMVAGHDDYVDAIHTNVGYRPTIPPGDDARLGDVGIIQDGRFSRMANLEDFGIEFEQRTDDSTVSYYYESESGVESKTKAKGESGAAFEVLGEAEAGVQVTFSGKNKVVFKATDCRETKIDNVDRVKREVMALAADDGSDWDDEYSVVTEKLTAESFVVLVSGSAGGTVELRAKGDAGQIGSLETELGFDKELAYSENMSLKTVSESGGTPLFRVLRPKKSLVERIRDRFPEIFPSEDTEYTPTPMAAPDPSGSEGDDEASDEEEDDQAAGSDEDAQAEPLSDQEREQLVDSVFEEPRPEKG